MSRGLTNNINRQLQQSSNSIEKKLLMKNGCISMEKIYGNSHFFRKKRFKIKKKIVGYEVHIKTVL